MSYRDDIEVGGVDASMQVFGRKALPSILDRGHVGFTDVTGFHIYCELRPSPKLEIAESDEKALKYLQTIEEYVNHGVRSASPFNVALLELQGNILHFFKEGEAELEPALDAIQFVYLFTTILYEELKPELGDDWDGFASCVDHGRTIIVRHGFDAKASTVSLSPAANRPAKQLLYGRTPAGCLDVPSAWAKALGVPRPVREWTTINLRDRQRIPFLDRLENQQRRQELQDLIRAYRANPQRRSVQQVSLLKMQTLYAPTGFALTTPHRVQASCLMPDLDGFSPIVGEAFKKGEKAVEQIAYGFAEILEFGDFMEHSTPGSIRLPWAGDRATLLVPPTLDFSATNRPRWLDVAMKWQSFAAGTPEAKDRRWANIFQSVKWAIGACHGAAGLNVVAPIHAQGRNFLVGGGWPMAMSLDAQNQGKGGDIVTHNIDYEKLDGPSRSQFNRLKGTDFWKTTEVTPDKLRKAAIEIGEPETPAGEDYLAKCRSIQVPSPRPHFQ